MKMQKLVIRQPTLSFFGYKTHIAMTEERIITAATITSGEKNRWQRTAKTCTKK